MIHGNESSDELQKLLVDVQRTISENMKFISMLKEDVDCDTGGEQEGCDSDDDEGNNVEL